MTDKTELRDIEHDLIPEAESLVSNWRLELMRAKRGISKLDLKEIKAYLFEAIAYRDNLYKLFLHGEKEVEVPV